MLGCGLLGGINTQADTKGISLPTFTLRTNLKLYIPVTPKLVKKVTTNLDFLKESSPDYISVEILKNCESCILAELFNMCLKKSYFPD